MTSIAVTFVVMSSQFLRINVMVSGRGDQEWDHLRRGSAMSTIDLPVGGPDLPRDTCRVLRSICSWAIPGRPQG